MPTLFYNSNDDPFVKNDFSKANFALNLNTVLVSTDYGGHVASFETVLKQELWLVKPVISFFGAIMEA